MKIKTLHRSILALSLLAFALVPCARAQEDPQTATQTPAAAPASPLGPPGIPVPESPIGTQLTWFLSVLSGEDPGDVASHFGEDFKKAIPPDLVARQFQQVASSVMAGGPTVLDSIGPGMDAHNIKGRLRSRANGVVLSFVLAVEPDTGLISNLSAQVIPGVGASSAATWDALDEKLAALPGTANFHAARLNPDGSLTTVHTFNPGARLATGSTFKLYVLGALAQKVQRGEATWDQLLAIRDDWKSLPSGVMQNDEAGTEHPLSEYALKMISISDNTATDHLIHFLGREPIEAFMATTNADPARSTPFLTTRDMFAMKLGDDQTLAGRYIAADTAARRAMLAEGGEVATAVPSMIAAAVWTAPLHIDTIEWFATAEECCRVIAAVDALAKSPGNAPAGAAIRANPGIGFDRAVWKSIAFKGGSERGVMNLTWLVDRADGARFALSIGWNDPKTEVAHDTLIDLAGQGFGLLANAPAE